MDTSPSQQVRKYAFGFHDRIKYPYRVKPGLSLKTVEEISYQKNEPEWMKEFRARALDFFKQRPLPNWGAPLSTINFDKITYYVKPTEGVGKKWAEVPETIKNTFDRLGIPEAEKKYLAGVKTQYESEVVY